MNKKHQDIHRLREQGNTFQVIADTFRVSRARAQQVYIEQVDFINMTTKHPCAKALRELPDGKTAAGWLIRFLEERKINATNVAAAGAQWLREQPGVGVGKVTKLAWALENQGIITSANVWLGGGACLK